MSLEIANALLGVFANAVRFYAIKRMIDIFLAKDKCRWEHTWILYMIACCYTSYIYELFKSPTWNVLANMTALLLIVWPYTVKFSKKILLISMIYIENVAVDTIVVFSFTKYIAGEPFNQVYECVTSLVILLISFILERTILTEKEVDLPLFYKVILGIVPLTSIMCIYYLAMMAIVQRQTMIIIASWILFVNIIIIYLYNALTQFYSEKIEKNALKQMVDVYANQLELVQESQQKVNSLRHDIKHHIIELSSMIKENENPQAIKYLNDMKQFMLNPKEYVATGNKEIDGVLNYLLQNVDVLLEHVDINVNMPEKNYCTNFNLCVIIGNLVDNAIREASKSEEKYLQINIQAKKGIVLIFVENSYSGKIIEQDNKFKTSQEMVSIHGLGLENVKKIVEANGGEISINYGASRFTVEVLLYLSNIK